MCQHTHFHGVYNIHHLYLFCLVLVLSYSFLNISCRMHTLEENESKTDKRSNFLDILRQRRQGGGCESVRKYCGTTAQVPAPLHANTGVTMRQFGAELVSCLLRSVVEVLLCASSSACFILCVSFGSMR